MYENKFKKNWVKEIKLYTKINIRTKLNYV